MRTQPLPRVPRLATAWLPPALYVAVIWLLSSQSDVTAPLLAIPHIDKVIHFVEYGVLAVLVARALALTTLLRPVVFSALAVGMTTAYGVIDELHQSYVPSRHASWQDAVADFAGACVLVAVYARYRARKARQ